MSTVTHFSTDLQLASNEDASAQNRVMAACYVALQKFVRHNRHRRITAAALQTDDVIALGMLRIGPLAGITGKGRAYFYKCWYQTLVRVLVDAERHRKAQKRGGGQNHQSGGEYPAPEAPTALELLAHVEACAVAWQRFDELDAASPVSAEAYELHFLRGKSHKEVSAALQIAQKEVAIHLRRARAFLGETRA